MGGLVGFVCVGVGGWLDGWVGFVCVGVGG